MDVTPELKELSMEYLLGMMLEDRSAREGRPWLELFREFRRSNTMKMLFDEETGLWGNGPAYLSDEWDLERMT